jgi:CRP/FNR family transcriptional regulator, cyclic AMP receptor protein
MLTLSDRAALSDVPLFTEFDKGELSTIARYLEAEDYAAGQVVIWSGSENRSLFVLLSGTAVVSIQIKGEVESVLARLEAGAHFGELTFIDGQPAAGTVTAEQPCRILRVPLDQMHKLRDEQNVLFGKLAWAMLHDLAIKLRRTNEKVHDAVQWGLEAAQIDPTD